MILEGDNKLNGATIGQNVGSVVTGGVTITAGMGTYLQFVPGVAGALASMAGFVLSVVLIRKHLQGIKTGRLEQKRISMQILVMQHKETERQEQVHRRRKNGKPVRRSDDKN